MSEVTKSAEDRIHARSIAESVAFGVVAASIAFLNMVVSDITDPNFEKVGLLRGIVGTLATSGMLLFGVFLIGRGVYDALLFLKGRNDD